MSPWSARPGAPWRSISGASSVALADKTTSCKVAAARARSETDADATRFLPDHPAGFLHTAVAQDEPVRNGAAAVHFNTGVHSPRWREANFSVTQSALQWRA